MKMKKYTTIRITIRFKKDLKNLKIIESESFEKMLKRLLLIRKTKENISIKNGIRNLLK